MGTTHTPVLGDDANLTKSAILQKRANARPRVDKPEKLERGKARQEKEEEQQFFSDPK